MNKIVGKEASDKNPEKRCNEHKTTIKKFRYWCDGHRITDEDAKSMELLINDAVNTIRDKKQLTKSR